MKFKDFESLGKNDDFQRVYKGRNSKADANLVVYIKGNTLEINRLGISVSKKIGNSVVRHRLTRVVREAFRINTRIFKTGYDIVTVIREPLKGKGLAEAERSLIKLLGKHGIVIDQEN